MTVMGRILIHNESLKVLAIQLPQSLWQQLKTSHSYVHLGKSKLFLFKDLCI